jgi:hypothetical protein
MEKYNSIKLPDNIDNLTMSAIEKGDRYKRGSSFKRNKVISAAAVVLVLTLGFSSVTFAAKFTYDYISSVFTMVKDAVGMRGDSQGAVGINKTVANKGISITVQEVISDEYGVYVSYIIKSSKAFVNTKDTNLPTSDDTKVSFSDTKLGGGLLTGRFMDAHTFIGIGTYNFDIIKEKIPQNFTFDIDINTVKLNGVVDGKGNIIRGSWKFSIPVTINKNGIKEIIPGKVNDIDVKKVSISKFHTRFEAEMPKDYIEKIRAKKHIFITTDKGENIDVVKFSLDGDNDKGIFVLWGRAIPEDANSVTFDLGELGKVNVDLK